MVSSKDKKEDLNVRKSSSSSGNLVYDIFPILFCTLAIPISTILWFVYVGGIFVAFGNEEYTPISPARLLFSTLAPLCLMVYALKRKAVNKSGAIFGIMEAMILSIASHAFFFSLVVFFFSSSRATKFRTNMKKKIENDFKEGGQRNWAQVLCNGGMATQLAILYLIDCGSGERPINFATSYRSSWLGIAVLSAFSCCNGDTWASELGSVLSKSDPFLITTRQKVPRGTNGGVSFIGLIVSLLGGLAVGLAYYIIIKCTVASNLQLISPPQWPLIITGGVAGLGGSIVDSLLGATLQYSGIDADGKIVEQPGKNIRHISGLRILDNHSVNLISSIITAVSIPVFALRFWPEI